jgi:hypothetical protein
MCGQRLLEVGRTSCFATSAYRQPLPRFPLTWSAKATRRCTTGRARMWYMHDGAPAHFSRAVRDVLSNTYQYWRIGRGGPTAWPPLAPDLSPLDFYPCLFNSSWQRRSTSSSDCGCLSEYPKPHRHFWMDAAVNDETCRGVHWISWREFWTLIVNLLFQVR